MGNSKLLYSYVMILESNGIAVGDYDLNYVEVFFRGIEFRSGKLDDSELVEKR